MANALKMLSSSQHRPDVSRVRHRANKNMAQWNLHIWNCCLDCARKIHNKNIDRLCSIQTLEKGSHPSESDDDLLRLGLRSDGSTRISMRLAFLKQQAKTLQREKTETGADIAKQIDNVKHLLWHEHSRSARRDGQPVHGCWVICYVRPLGFHRRALQ